MMNMPLTLALIMPGMVTKAKTKPKLTIEKKTMAVGQTYKLQLKGVSGTKKKVKQWKITGKGADYFRITDYGLLQMDWEPTYIEPCVTAKVTAILEDGRKLTAAVKAYSELNIYMDTVFTNFEKQYMTSFMTEKENQKRRHGISAQPLIMTYTTVPGLTFFSKEKGTAMQAAVQCSICAAIWESKPLYAGIMRRMGRHWFLRTANFI